MTSFSSFNDLTRTIPLNSNQNISSNTGVLVQDKKDSFTKKMFTLGVIALAGASSLTATVHQPGITEVLKHQSVVTVSSGDAYTKNGNMYTLPVEYTEASHMKNHRRLVPLKRVNSVLEYSDRPSRMLDDDLVENFEIIPAKRHTKIEFESTLEYAGQLPKRPII